MNKERLRKLIADGRMTPAGLASAMGVRLKVRFKIPPDIEKALKGNKQTWRNFKNFRALQKNTHRVRRGARNRPKEFKKRLNYFLKMMSKNKTFGYVKKFAA